MSCERGAILLADSDEEARPKAAATLRRNGFHVHEASTGSAALDELMRRRCDAVSCALELTDLNGLELLRRANEQGSVVPVLFTTTAPRLETAVLAMRLGAVDYLLEPISDKIRVKRVDEAVKKGRALRALLDARQQALALVQSVSALEAALSGDQAPSETRMVVAPPLEDPLDRLDPEQLSRLSPREREVARLLARGNAINDLASALDLSPNTVRNHVKSIFSKLRVHSQVALLSRLSGHGR